MPRETFLRPRLVGPRFEDDGIPLDMLGDLSAIPPLLVAVAKQRYLEDHPDRKRSPKGFVEKVSLRITGIDKGSAVPVIELFTEDDQYGLPEFSKDVGEYFRIARNETIDAIGAASSNENISLSPKFLKYFESIGKNLRDGEYIDFGESSRKKSAILNRDTRMRLVFASRSNEITEPVRIRAYVPEMGKRSMSFELPLINGEKIPANLSEQHYDAVLESLNAYQSDEKILIGGIGKYDHHRNLKKIESIDDITALDDLDVPSQIEELKSLKVGWMNGEGEAFSAGELDWLADSFDRLYPDGYPLPFVFPSVDGEVIAEWSFPPTEISLSVDLENQKGEFHALNVQNDTEDWDIYDLRDKKTWIEISRKIVHYANE